MSGAGASARAIAARRASPPESAPPPRRRQARVVAADTAPGARRHPARARPPHKSNVVVASAKSGSCGRYRMVDTRLQETRAVIRLDQSGCDAQQRRFARSVAPDQAQPLARRDREIDAGEQRRSTEDSPTSCSWISGGAIVENVTCYAPKRRPSCRRPPRIPSHHKQHCRDNEGSQTVLDVDVGGTRFEPRQEARQRPSRNDEISDGYSEKHQAQNDCDQFHEHPRFVFRCEARCDANFGIEQTLADLRFWCRPGAKCLDAGSAGRIPVRWPQDDKPVGCAHPTTFRQNEQRVDLRLDSRSPKLEIIFENAKID